MAKTPSMMPQLGWSRQTGLILWDSLTVCLSAMIECSLGQPRWSAASGRLPLETIPAALTRLLAQPLGQRRITAALETPRLRASACHRGARAGLGGWCFREGACSLVDPE